MRNYSSYLFRHWLLGGGSDGQHQVFDIEHIQSGRRSRVSSLNEAQAWIESVSLENRVHEEETDKATNQLGSDIHRP